MIILKIIAGIIGLCFALYLLPAIVGICIGWLCIGNGNIGGGVAAIIIGIAVNAYWLWSLPEDAGTGGLHEDECPFCGSGDTDGSHCYSCDEDF